MVSSLHCWNNSIWTALGTVEPPSSATRSRSLGSESRAASLGILSNSCCNLVLSEAGWERWDVLCPYWWRGYHSGMPLKSVWAVLRIWLSCKSSEPRSFWKSLLSERILTGMYAVFAFPLLLLLSSVSDWFCLTFWRLGLTLQCCMDIVGWTWLTFSVLFLLWICYSPDSLWFGGCSGNVLPFRRTGISYNQGKTWCFSPLIYIF